MSPASSAVMSKATPISAALLAKPNSSFLAIPACPALAIIELMPCAVMGSVLVSRKISASITFSSAGLSKSTTFFTSAIALSKSTACLMGKARLAPIATTPTACPRMSDFIASFLLWSSVNFPILVCLAIALSSCALIFSRSFNTFPSAVFSFSTAATCSNCLAFILLTAVSCCAIFCFNCAGTRSAIALSMAACFLAVCSIAFCKVASLLAWAFSTLAMAARSPLSLVLASLIADALASACKRLTRSK